MYVDGELDANTATRRLLTIDTQQRASRPTGHDEAPAVGGNEAFRPTRGFRASLG